MVSAQQTSSCIICSLGQVKCSLDKYIMAIYLSLGKCNFGCFHIPVVAFIQSSNHAQSKGQIL